MKASRSDRFAALGAATKAALRRADAALEIASVVGVVAVVAMSLAFATRPSLAEADSRGLLSKAVVSTVAQGGPFTRSDYGQADGLTEAEHQGTGTPRRVQKTLDAAGRTTHVLNDGRVEREYEFQPATGRLLAEKTPTREQRYSYDGGSLWAKAVATGEAQTGPSCSAFLPSTTTEIRRDAQGRPVAETKSDGKSTTYLWDEEGRPLLTREGAEAQILTWDSRGALARLNRPSGRGETTFGYDLDGRPIRQVHTVPGLLAPEVTSAGIDAAGRRTSLNLPDGGTELYRYDSDGELSEVTRPDGVKVGIERDRANRITRILPTAAGPTRAVLDGGVEFTYDVLSRLLETKRLPGPGGASGVNVGMPTYDLAGRVLSEVVAGRAPMQRSYDTKGRVLSVTLPSGTQLDRTYQTCSDRLETISGAGLSASFAWTGARLLGVTTSGARKVAHRYGYADGPGAPGGPGARVWQLATLTHGTAGTSNPLTEALHPLGDPQAPGSRPWGQLSYGYRKGDGAKLGRKVVASPSIGAGGSVPNVPSIVGLMGAAWDVDAGRRLREAALGEGSDSGDSGIDADVRAKAASLFAYDYSNADQLAREVRVEGTASRIKTLSSGSDGRPENIQIDALPATPIRYESGSLLESGRRQEDDRHLYEWYWHGKLAKVTKRPGTLNAGQETRYLYDGLGRLYSRETRDAAGLLTERREYVFEDERLVEEQSYIDTTSTSLRWRKTYLPGAMGAVTVKDERYLPGTTTPTSTTVSSYLRDELGSVLGLVEEAGSSGPAPLKQRFFYTPYGEAHVELGPETRRAIFEQSITTVNGQSQAPAAEHLGGAVRVKLSIAIDPATYSGIVVEKLTGGAWGALQAAQLALGRGDADSEVLVLPLQGWALGSAYRVRVTPALKDAFARVALASEAQLQLPQPPPPGQPAALSFSWEKSFPVDYRTDEAAQWSGILFQNLYADDVTGLFYTPGRWYDPVTASWLSKDGGASDSPSLYAFVKGRPHELIDPMGEAGMTPDEQLAEEAGEDDEGEDPSFAHAEGSMERLRELSDQTEGFSDLTCLARDTVVFTPEGYVPIGDLSVGKRVLTPETLVTLSKETEVSEKTHRLVKLRLESEALGGTVVEIDTLVSLEEIERDGLHVGAVLAIDADEIGPEHAEVLSIEPSPAIEDRPGRLVTSTFRHIRKGALAATLRAEDGEEDTVFLTREHPVFVEGWGYRRLGDVAVGECVRTTEGEELRLVSVVLVEGEVELRNLEVEGEHAYFAGFERALVHNGRAKVVEVVLEGGAARVKAGSKTGLIDEGIQVAAKASRTAKPSSRLAKSAGSVVRSSNVVVGHNGLLKRPRLNPPGPKPARGTVSGDLWRHARYKLNGGLRDFDEWYRLSRGSRPGGPKHQAKIAEITERLLGEGKEILHGPGGGEFMIRTPGGLKDVRFGDVVARDPLTGLIEIHQVGRAGKRGRPVPREIEAFRDIKRFAADPRLRYAQRYFHRYN